MNFRKDFSENLNRALDEAMLAAAHYGVSYTGSEHVLFAMLKNERCVAYRLLTEAGVSLPEYTKAFLRTLDRNSTVTGLTPRTEEMFVKAARFAESSLESEKVGTAHFLLALTEYPTCYAMKILASFGVDLAALKKNTEDVLRAVRHGGYPSQSDDFSTGNKKPERVGDEEKKPKTVKEYDYFEEEKSKEKSGFEKLSAYGVDLTKKARQGKIDPVIGREEETEKLVQVLARRTKNNPVLVGPAGVGKSAIVEGLARLIVSENVPEQLINKTLFSVDIAGMLAGARYRGDFEERLKDLIDVVQSDGDIILFIDEIHTIVGAGASSDNSMDAANILKPLLSRGELQVIGATTVDEYTKYIEKDSALERRFTKVNVEEPSEEATLRILQGLRPKYEEHHGILISDDALDCAVKLSVRYITDRNLPDKAIDLIDEACASVIVSGFGAKEETATLRRQLSELDEKRQTYEEQKLYKRASECREKMVEIEDKMTALLKSSQLTKDAEGRLVLAGEQIAGLVASKMKIPVQKITQSEGEKLMRLEEDLHKRIIGQNEAVSAVARAIRRARAGIKDPSRPIGSFIFVGPTGVGKTDLCKALAESLFGSEDQMIRLDMGEYMEKQSVSKLIGSAPGYVGYDDMQSGLLTEKVRQKPYSVVLFDEIEKAHRDIFDLLLPILDDGRLTDSHGRTVNFKNAVIILTSNVGADVKKAEQTNVYGFGSYADENGVDEKAYERMKDTVYGALKERFRPEFLNRMDDIIVFHKLTKQEAERIADKLISALSNRLYSQHGIILTVSETALSALVDEGYDASNGARPLKRVIGRRIEDKLSEEILLGKITDGQRVNVDYVDGTYCMKTV